VTRQEVCTLVEMLMTVLDDRRDIGAISDQEWARLAALLSRWAAMWLREATDGVEGDQFGRRGW
jgi:hypothetical protein